MPYLAADRTPAGGGSTASPFFSPGLQLHLALSTHSLAHGVQDLTTQPQGPSLPTYPVLLVGATTGLAEGEQLSSAGVREVTSAALSVLDTMCRQGNQPQLLQGHSLHSTGRPSRTFAGLAFSRRATSASKAAFIAELMRKSPLAVPLQRGQAVLTVHVPVDTRPIIPGTYTVTVKMVEVRGAPQAAGIATTAAAGSPAPAAAGVADLGGNTLGGVRPAAAMAPAADIVDHVGDVQMQEAAGLGDAAAAAGGASGPLSGAPPLLPVLVAGGSNRAAAAALRAALQQQPSSQQRVATGGLSGVQPAAGVGGPPAARPRPTGAGPAGVQQQHSGAPAPRPPLDQRAAAGQDQEQTAVMRRYLAGLADLNLQQKRRLQQQQQQELQRQGKSPRPRTGSQVGVLATRGGQDGAGGAPGAAASRRGQCVDVVDHVGDVQMQEAAGVGDAAAAAGGARGPPAVASPSLPALVAGGSTRAAAAPLRAERQQQPSSQQRVAVGGISGGQPSAGVGGPPAARRRTADAGPAGAQQPPSGAPAPQPPFDQRAAARQEQKLQVVMRRYLADLAELTLQQQRRVEQQQQQEQQRQDGASSPPHVPTGRLAGGQQAGGDSGSGRQGGGAGRAVPQAPPQAGPPLQTSQPAGGGKGRGRGLGAPAGVSADTAGRTGGGAGSEAEYGADCLTRDTCVAIGSDLVTHQNRCADVQGYEWAQLGRDTLGGRLLAYLHDQGATVPNWAVCRVPAGRTAVLAQLRDEFTGWWRLYSAQPADTPLPSDVTEQLDNAAQQAQTAYMDYVLLDARTLRSAKRGPADPGGAGGPSRWQRQHRSRSTSSLMSLGSAPLRPGGASSGAASMSTSSGGAPPSQGGARRGKRHSSNSTRNRHGAAVADKPAFFAGLHPHLATDRVLVVGGDWNCVTDASQEVAPSPSRAAGAPQLASLLAQFSLVDPWASKRGGAKGYTHPATPKPATPARLDRWYVSATAAPWVVDVARTYGAPGDHNGVLLTLSLPDLPHAHREQWRFPTYLLFHPSLRLELEQRLEAHVAANPVASTGDGACTQWEADKFFLREAATSIHRRHARQTRDGLHGVVLAADAAAALADRPGASAAQRQAAAMANLAVLEERAAAAAASHNARAALMEEHGERGTRWFHRQADEPAAGAQEPITHLKVPGQPAPVALTGPGTRNTVSAAAAAMYSSTSPTGLFRVQPVCTASQQQLLAAIDRKVPADLHAAAEGSGDGALSDAELMAVLAGSANGKAPGSDGVPYEVYKVFWALLGPRLCAAAAAAFAAAADAHDGGEMAAALPASWREGIITLIYKGKSLDRAELASYRPITLLNCDFKMVSKAVSARLQPALDAVVDELQTAFITGRWIGDNALYLQGLIEWMRLDVGADGTPRQGGALYFLDIEKAYDRVHRQWLYASAEGLGFGPRMLRWIRLITANGSARVCVNGMLSDAFPVLNGLPQGSTASPPLWVIQMQPLTSFLRRQVEQGALRTPLLPSGEQAPPAAHHADDTTLTARDPAVDGPVLMAAVQLFCRASNARVHPDKSKAMGLGRFAHLTGPCPHTGVPFTTGAVTHLGVPLSWDSDAAAADLHTRRARGMAFVARLWAALSLTLVGRVHIAKQVLAAKLAYHFSFLNPSPAQLKELTDLVDHFAARSMHAEDASLVSHGNPLLLPKRETACLPYKDGGVNHVDLPAFLSALQAKTFALLAQPGRQPWKMLTWALLTHPGRGVEQHPPQPATQPPAAPPQWRVSLDQLWVANTAGAVSYVHYTGRLLEPGPGVLPPAVDGAWQPACVLQHRKPRHLWTFEERAAYDAASPGDRAGSWPRAPYFLAPEAGVVVHPEHCRIAGVSLADYTVRDVRRAITAANPAAPLAPARPAAMPCPAPAQQAGGKGVEQHPPQPATQPPAAPPQWRVSLDQLWVANAAGAVSYVHYTGRLLEPGPGVLPPAVDGAWQPACVLQHRKPRHLWTFEERAAYDAASPGDRAGSWPRAPYFLAPEAGVVVHPEHCRIAGVSLADYTVRDVRWAITAANPAAPPAPARPAAMPCPAPAQQAGGSGTQPAARSRLAEREAEWQRAAAQLVPLSEAV
ncbi:hypothetical protein CHLRE_10g445226v5 [Chlamydomonas reinhardtii]|uniref:Reverse transcriptase domain-containing protein n=1 Tax=Chlamydomonas reinhardtii TaxID=3055 RepID=A0A2K3DAT0_CHLRE|nr:uncharacterized protein CHLRE_10g445226v5 [Chlamydomonas reinhardtii]PNW77638.1 hypothetical protein CHLRE_10g445226v5 [Chlamydomonas reinhardtii]